MFTYGTVTTGNIKEVTDQLRKMLERGPYTVVNCFEYKNYEPEVHLHRELGGSVDGNDVDLYFHDSGVAQVTICYAGGVGGFDTAQTELGYDPGFNAPYAAFKDGQFRITHRMPDGKLARSVYAPEKGE